MSAPEEIEGFIIGGASDGQRLCTGCWDRSGDVLAPINEIPEGKPIYWKQVSYEYNEWDAYCRSCALAHNEDLETEGQLLAGLDTLTQNQ